MNPVKPLVLLSLAKHPLSGKEICSPNDLRALSLVTEAFPDFSALHVGAPGHPALHTYLGYGIPALDVIKTEKTDETVHSLAEYLSKNKPALVVAGMRALGGIGSGLLPYMLAERLGYPLISGIVSIKESAGKLHCSQYLPKGRRRDFTVAPPLFVTVHPRAFQKIQYVWARQHKGEIREVSFNNSNPTGTRTADSASFNSPLSANWHYAPAQKKRARLSVRSNRSGFERMQRAISLQTGGGNILKEGDARAKAQFVYNILKERKVCTSDHNNHHNNK